MDYLKCAVMAARRAGQVHKRYFRSSQRPKIKSSSFDLLTVADLEAEKSIVSFISRYFPQHNFLAEENLYPKTDSAYTWIIDPLDGTNNFACGLPIFCASVALKYQDKIIAAAVYDASRDELFYAKKGGGAYLNGRRVFVSRSARLKDALLITGFYYSRGREMIATLEAIKRFHLKKILGIRRLGAAALDLCYVASGRATGFWEFALSPWDFAAGTLLVAEASGKVSGSRGEEIPLERKYFIVASNSRIHSQMLQVICKSYGRRGLDR